MLLSYYSPCFQRLLQLSVYHHRRPYSFLGGQEVNATYCKQVRRSTQHVVYRSGSQRNMLFTDQEVNATCCKQVRRSTQTCFKQVRNSMQHVVRRRSEGQPNQLLIDGGLEVNEKCCKQEIRTSTETLKTGDQEVNATCCKHEIRRSTQHAVTWRGLERNMCIRGDQEVNGKFC